VFFPGVQLTKRKRVHSVILNAGMATIHRLSNVKGHVQMGPGIPGLHAYSLYTRIFQGISRTSPGRKAFFKGLIVAPDIGIAVQRVTKNVSLGLHSVRVQPVRRFVINPVVGILVSEMKNLFECAHPINPTWMLVYVTRHVTKDLRV